ncbi:MAG: ImmA/IrrE family metallo-endopeptidase, partial [Proteobacteria bacterium]|nr:ImmA/IrrE family metallo-endopeptidase [Pseudomonadota bacterium]
IAHEGYHAMVHIPEFRKKRAVLKSINDEQHASLCLYRQEDVPIYMNPEWQAFRFAGALLMPEEPFKASIRNGYGVRDLADLFQANPANVCSRAKALSILLK